MMHYYKPILLGTLLCLLHWPPCCHNSCQAMKRILVMESKLMWMVQVVADAHESLVMFPTLALAGNY